MRISDITAARSLGARPLLLHYTVGADAVLNDVLSNPSPCGHMVPTDAKLEGQAIFFTSIGPSLVWCR